MGVSASSSLKEDPKIITASASSSCLSPSYVDALECFPFYTDNGYKYAKQRKHLQRFIDGDPTLTVLELKFGTFDAESSKGSMLVVERLKTSTTLKELILYSCFIHEDCIKCFIDGLANNQSLEIIYLNRSSAGKKKYSKKGEDRLATIIGMAIKKNNHLKAVIMGPSCQISNDGLVDLSAGLAHHNSIEKIDITCDYPVRSLITYKGIQVFSMMLGTNKVLKEVNLRNCGLGLQATEVLVASLERNATLEAISLDHNFLMRQAEVSELLVAMIKNKLKRVSLSDCNLLSNQVVSIIKGLTENTHASLEYMDISDNTLDVVYSRNFKTSEAIKDLLRSTVTRIKVLKIRNARLGANGIKNIAEGLEHNTSVEEIDLSFNYNGDDDSIDSDYDDGSDDSNDSNDSNASDDSVNSSNSDNDDESDTTSHNAVNKNDNDDDGVSKRKITNMDAIISIIHMLKSNHTLKIINLRGWSKVGLERIGFEASRALFEAVASNPTIERVHCDGVYLLNDELGAMFAKLLKTNSNLRVFHVIFGGLLSKKGRTEIVDAVRQNYTITEIWGRLYRVSDNPRYSCDDICEDGYQSWSSDEDCDERLYVHKQPIDLFLERNRRGLGKCLMDDEDRKVLEVEGRNACDGAGIACMKTGGIWPHIFFKLGSNIPNKRILENNSESDYDDDNEDSNTHVEASLLFYMIREKPDIFSYVTYNDDNRKCRHKCNESNAKKRPRLQN